MSKRGVIDLTYEDDDKAIQKRRERRERDAKARSGELPLPKPVIEYDEKKAVHMKTMCREGIELKFTARELYRSQLQVITASLRAMERSRSVILESPTGTGKTLAALWSALAWQRARRQTKPTRIVWVARTHDQLSHAVSEYRRHCAQRPLMSLRLSRERFCLHPNILTAPNKAEACEEATKIANNMTKSGRFDSRNSGCAHLDTAESIGYPQSHRYRKHFRLGGPMNTYDIEEAVAEGNQLTVCPFHMAQDQIQEGAALIFITYQQLIEPITRRAGGMEQVLEDAVIVVDEAHNLPQVSRDAASYDITEARLESLVETLVDFLPHLDKHKEAQDMLRSLVAQPNTVIRPKKKNRKSKKMLFASTTLGGPLVSLLTWLRQVSRGDDPDPLTTQEAQWSDGRQVRIWDGEDAAQFVREVIGLKSCDRVDEHCKILWKLRKTLIEEGLESGAVRSDTINDLEALLIKLRYLLLDDSSTHYRLIVRGPSKNKDDVSASPSLSFCCLSGTVAMRTLLRGQRAVGLGEASYLKPARSMLLLSGTLRPFPLYARELGFDLLEKDNDIPPSDFVNVKAEEEQSRTYEAAAVKAVHLRSIECQASTASKRPGDCQLLALHLAVAAGGVSLDASHKNTKEPDAECARQYFVALAQALYGIALATPSGVLVFFKSYKLLEDTLKYWDSSGWRSKINTVKAIFVEERELTGDEFDDRIRKYKLEAKSTRGAILLAVMRGRAAEGADFKDEAARLVAIVGLPYPPLLDTAIRLKKEHEDRVHGAGSGNKWYAAEAWRSINQAAGRLIRHQHDFGALVLLDKSLFNRNQKPPNELISEWYGKHIETLDGATSLHNRLKDFFAAKSPSSSIPPPRGGRVLASRPPNSSHDSSNGLNIF